jgi:two-component system, OmpR family, response regulator
MTRLLIVDDDSSLRKLYEAEFGEDGYEVESVGSGEEAIARLQGRSPEVVVLDIQLGGMNGLDVLRRVLDDRPDIAVILNSAYSGYKQNFASWSADGYVVKSSDLSELKTAVARAVRGRARVA